MEETRNLAILTGCPAGRPVFSHKGHDGDWFTFPMRVERLSGAFDEINILVTEALMASTAVGSGEKLTVRGEVRSYNNKSGVGRRLIISVMAKEMYFTEGRDENAAVLMGTLCRPPVLRRTPMGRQICDMMLAVSRRYGRSDYLPCIAWGSLARKAADWEVGTDIAASGRIQSRKYIKTLSDSSEERVAYEISLARAEPWKLPSAICFEGIGREDVQFM